VSNTAVQLTQVEREVLGMEIREKGCDICMRVLKFNDGARVCRTGLKFPYCRKNKKRGFKLNEK